MTKELSRKKAKRNERYSNMMVNKDDSLISASKQPSSTSSFFPLLELEHLSLLLLLASELESLQRLMVTWSLRLQSVHSKRRTIFLVVLAFFLKMGLVWPPYPFCLRS